MKINTKKGFTLIELLVVMVIIGILAGIGIAQFKDQQKKALDAKNIANKVQSCRVSAADCAAAESAFCEKFKECMTGSEMVMNFGGGARLVFPVDTTAVKLITFKAEIKDTSFVLFAGQSTGTFLMASNSGNGLYHQAAGSAVVTVDGVVVNSLIPFYNDGIMHSYSVSNIDIPTWTTFGVSNYPYTAPYRFVGSMRDLKLFGASDELLHNYSDFSGSSILDSTENAVHGSIWGVSMVRDE